MPSSRPPCRSADTRAGAAGPGIGPYAVEVTTVRLDILAWLLVPLAVTVLAVLWARWRSRPRGPADAHESMADMVRFREAMAKPLPGSPGSVRDDGQSVGGPDRGAA